jgi:hypothetical protein
LRNSSGATRPGNGRGIGPVETTVEACRTGNGSATIRARTQTGGLSNGPYHNYDVREQLASLQELVQSLYGKSDEAYPLFTLTRQAETAARGCLKNDSARAGFDAIERAERDAARDVAMLFYLFMGVNDAFLHEKRALHLLVLLLLHSVRDWLAPVACARGSSRFLVGSRQRWSSSTRGQHTVERLRDRYFQGICPLMPETEEQLAFVVAQGELVVEIFNDHLVFETITRKRSGKRKPPLPTPLDLTALKHGAEARGK